MAGTVKARKSGKYATSDWLEVEKQRGISVASSVMQFGYDDCVINLLDTPGHKDFSEDTYRVLTAVDAAVMVVDAAKGVEEQTIKLLEVCRLRDTPIITFINKLDREVREPLELLDEIESILKIHCAPVTWPIGMGKRFHGVYHLLNDEVLRFIPGEEKAARTFETLRGDQIDRLRNEYPMEFDTMDGEMELVRGAGAAFHWTTFLKGKQTPVFFGSGINNFGVREILRALVDWAPPPQPRAADTPTGTRYVDPAEQPFTGFVFKIQANMDPNHRDRIAFFRVCSGQYTPGMKVKQRRTNKEIKIANAVVFMANERSRMERPTPATSRRCGRRLAALGAEVDQPVGGLDDVEVVLDDDDGVAVVAQAVQHLEQHLDVLEVQAGGRLVEDVERAAGVALGQFQRQLDALRLAAGQRGGALAELDVAEADVEQGLQLARHHRHASKNSCACSTVMRSTSWMVLPL
jgi:peptide chain release factor 3